MDIIFEKGKYYKLVKEEMPEGWVLDREIGKLQEQMDKIRVEIIKLEEVNKYGKEKESGKTE